MVFLSCILKAQINLFLIIFVNYYQLCFSAHFKHIFLSASSRTAMLNIKGKSSLI